MKDAVGSDLGCVRFEVELDCLFELGPRSVFYGKPRALALDYAPAVSIMCRHDVDPHVGTDLTISEDSRARSDIATSPNIGNTLYDNSNSINASSIPPHARVPPSSSGGASSGAVSIGGNNDSSNSSTPTPPAAPPM
ncbi:hypothetical protein SeLEV6574_g06227 [Synchytrium endobioticum]|uniref:Uncharacterized protein n=1 Tax=Synchytrium endobioticum TaxID=286115 RepID=A0A507CPW8_9FUNG|nr:hypothetical protein SeLEV6574_g06227 [Synchytrium endobioticum]